MFRLIDKIKGVPVYTNNDRLTPLLDNTNNSNQPHEKYDIDISYKYSYDPKKEIYIANISFNMVPRFILYRNDRKLVFITKDTIHLRFYRHYTRGTVCEGDELVFSKDIPIGGTLTIKNEYKSDLTETVESILHVFKCMKNDVYENPNDFMYKMFLTDSNKITFDNIAYVHNYQLKDYMKCIQNQLVKSITRIYRTYGEVEYYSSLYSSWSHWFSGESDKETRISVGRFVDDYDKIGIFTNVKNGNLIPLRIHMEELPKDLEKEKTFKI